MLTSLPVKVTPHHLPCGGLPPYHSMQKICCDKINVDVDWVLTEFWSCESFCILYDISLLKKAHFQHLNSWLWLERINSLNNINNLFSRAEQARSTIYLLFKYYSHACRSLTHTYLNKMAVKTLFLLGKTGLMVRWLV